MKCPKCDGRGMLPTFAPLRSMDWCPGCRGLGRICDVCRTPAEVDVCPDCQPDHDPGDPPAAEPIDS